MSGEIRRENFADEASYLQFQRNMLEMERLQQERDRMYGHATRGRDYDIIKRINLRIQKRLQARRRYSRNPELVRTIALRWYHGHRSKVADYQHRRWLSDKDYRERCLLYHREWVEANKDRVREYQRAHRAQNVDHYRERDRQYYQEHKLVIAARKRERARERYANDPEYREQRSQRKRDRYISDPEYRENLLLKQRESRARKRAEKLAQQQGKAS